MRKKSFITNDILIARTFVRPFLWNSEDHNTAKMGSISLFELRELNVLFFPETVIKRNTKTEEITLKELVREDKISLIITQTPEFFKNLLSGEVFLLKRDELSSKRNSIGLRDDILKFFLQYQYFISLEDYLFNPDNCIQKARFLSIKENISPSQDIYCEYQIVKLEKKTLVEIFMDLKNGKARKITCRLIIFMKYILMRVFLPKGDNTNGRYSYKKKLVSRPPHYWKPAFEKWKNYFSNLLWCSTKLFKQEVKNFRHRLPLPSYFSTREKIFHHHPNKRMDTKMVSSINKT